MFTQAINERTSGRYTAMLTDETGAVVPGSTLETLTLSLYEANGGTTVNNRNAQNVLNANNVTVDSNGLLTWLIQPGDTAIINNRLAIESHIAEFKATWSSGTKEFTHRLQLDIVNFSTIT